MHKIIFGLVLLISLTLPAPVSAGFDIPDIDFSEVLQGDFSSSGFGEEQSEVPSDDPTITKDYAVEIVEHSTFKIGEYTVGTGIREESVLGAPDGIAGQFDNSGSINGFVKVRLGSKADKLRIYIYDFFTGEPESFYVYLSDGTTEVSAGLVSPNSTNPNNRLILPFDLTASSYGIPYIQYVKIVNANNISSDHEGPDIDSFEVLIPDESEAVPHDTPQDASSSPQSPPVPQTPQCSDGIDNDTDGNVDVGDPDCSSPIDDNEFLLISPPSPPPQSVLSLATLSGSLVRANSPATLTWGAENVVANSCRLSGTNGDWWQLSGTAGTKLSSNLTNKTTFTLSCTSLDTRPVSASVVINVTPNFKEI